MRPDFVISGLSAAANDRVLSISVKRTVQGKSDSATFTLDDRDYKLDFPQKGKIITVQMGYKETGLVMMGEFEVDQVRHKDAQAATFEITANAQKHRGSNMKTRREGFYDEKTIQQIVGEIAGRNGYSPKVDPDVASFFYDHLDQNEGDAHFLQRLSVKHDCYVKYENGQLIFWKRDNPLGNVTIARGPGGGNIATELTASVNTRNEFTGVRAIWHNRDSGESYKEVVGGGDKIKDLPRTYTNKAEAKAAAAGEFSRLARGTGTIESLTIPGDPSVASGLKLTLVNFRPEFCALEWKITSDTHDIGSGGYKTTIQAEVQGSQVDGGG